MVYGFRGRDPQKSDRPSHCVTEYALDQQLSTVGVSYAYVLLGMLRHLRGQAIAQSLPDYATRLGPLPRYVRGVDISLAYN